MCQLCELADLLIQDTDIERASALSNRFADCIKKNSNAEVILACSENIVNAAINSDSPQEMMEVYKRVLDLLLISYLQTRNKPVTKTIH